ncbi:MAG: TylF/MycF/NovP-related O-methyltransferase [Solirubrobacteraceae bacterium]
MQRPDPPGEGVDRSHIDKLAISLEEVQANFRRFALLDDHIRFLPG